MCSSSTPQMMSSLCMCFLTISYADIYNSFVPILTNIFSKIFLYQIFRHKPEAFFLLKSPTKPHRIDPCTFLFFILDNKAIWIQTTAKYLRHFSVSIYRKTLDFTTFSVPTTFITLCPSLSKMQKIIIFVPRPTPSFRVKIGANF